MFVYSEKIVEFVKKLTFTVKTILQDEVGLMVRGDRFYDKTETFSFPIKIVIFNSKGKLGYFDANFLELGFHQCVIYSSKQVLENLIRHELAHYLTFIKYREGFLPHGPEFKSICKEYHWGKEVYEASTTTNDTPFREKSNVARKIEKLLALGASTNPHESSLAILKSRELLLKHNISDTFDNTGEIILKRILKQTRMNAKIQSCSHILKTFFVSTVYSYGRDCLYLEIIGSAVNVEIAEYIANVLDGELDRLWAASGLKGVSAKNSFFDGIAKGYCKKIEDLNNKHDKDAANALMKIENTLSIAQSLIYPHLSQSKTSRRLCPLASSLGEQAGKNLEFKKAMSGSKTELKFISN